MSTTLRIQQGETLRLKVEVEELGAETAELIATDGTNTITKLSNFVGLIADVSTNETDKPAGSYDYYVRVTWPDGTVDIYPDPKNCGSNCKFPQLIICALPEVES